MLLLLSFLLWCSDEWGKNTRTRTPSKEYTHPYSMMHRRLPTVGIELPPHYHQFWYCIVSMITKTLKALTYIPIHMHQVWTIHKKNQKLLRVPIKSLEAAHLLGMLRRKNKKCLKFFSHGPNPPLVAFVLYFVSVCTRFVFSAQCEQVCLFLLLAFNT